MPLDLLEELQLVADTLGSNGIEYAVCGAFAVAAHGFPRATKDIDFLILAEDLSRAKQVLAPAGYDLDSGEIPFDLGKPSERKIHRLSKVEGEDHLVLDLMIAGPIWREVWNTRQDLDFRGRVITFVSREGLIAMKRMAGRLSDLADIEKLGEDPRRE